nr:glycine-rich domain-containing protein-like [Candidatus Saccharibacteria bacterium]
MSQALAVDEVITLVDELDLEPIIFKMMNPDHEEGMSLEAADIAVDRYRMFLKLCAMYPDRAIVPTAEIDSVWHTHILDTAKYRYDCDRIFGKFLDHFPYLGLRGEEDAAQLAASFDETCKLFVEHFGVMPSGEAMACGESCGGTLCENPACSGNSCSGTVQP